MDESHCYAHGQEFCDNIGGIYKYKEGNCTPCKNTIFQDENVIAKGKCLNI